MTPEVRDRIDQIRQGIVPEGYKKTKSGILPESWSVRTIAECLERVEHPVEVQANEMYTQIGIRSHGKGLFYKEPVTGDSLGNKSVFWIEPDCFILNIVFAWEQAVGKTTQAEAGMIGSHRFPMNRPINGSIDIDYLISYLLTKRGTDILEAASPGGAGRNRTLGQDRFMKSRIVLPPLDEQKKIAEILSTQDKAIELQERKIEELKRFKKGCLEKMFPRKGQKVPETRFPGFTGDWEQRKVSTIASDTRGGGTPATSNETYWSGNIPWIQSSDLSEGKLFGVEPRKYISRDGLNNSATQLVPENSIAVVTRVGVGKLAFMPFSYTTSQDFLSLCKLQTEPHFTVYALYQMLQGELQAVQGTSIKGMTKDDLLSKSIFAPKDEVEQQQLGSYFRNLDTLITLHQRKLEEMKKQKKALMQLLLTGIVKTKGEVR